MWAARRPTIGCLWRPFFSGTELAFLGATFRSVSVIGKSSTSGSAGGRRVEFSNASSSYCERPRQRIHDDRRHHCARSPAQRRRAKKKRRASDRPIARRTDHQDLHPCYALGNPVDLMITPGQAHDLACAELLLAGADPDALIGDKAYDADPLIETLTRRQNTPVIPPKANRKLPRVCDFALYCERNSSNASSTSSSTFAPSPRATTSSPEISSPVSSSPRLSSCSTEDRP